MRQFFPLTFRWRDASGRTANTHLYWAGELDDLLDNGLPGILCAFNDPASPPFPRPLEWCSNAALEAVDGPVPVGYFGLDGSPRYGRAGHPYCTCLDVLNVQFYSQFDPHAGPPSPWSFEIPAPRMQPATEEEADLWFPFTGVLDVPQGAAATGDGDSVINALLSQFNAYVGGAPPPARWDSAENAETSAWCSADGFYLTNFSCLPRLGHRPPPNLSTLSRQADLTRAAL